MRTFLIPETLDSTPFLPDARRPSYSFGKLPIANDIVVVVESVNQGAKGKTSMPKHPFLFPMKERDPLEHPDLDRLQLYIYLIPVLGFFPALWTLYRRQGTREQRSVSRLSITLAFSWLLGYILLSSGVQFSEFWTIRLLFLNGLLTSGYFLVSIGLMVRLWQRKTPRLPGISRLAEGVVRKHLS